MAASDAKPIPLKNTAFRVTFPIYDNDGDLVVDALLVDAWYSLDSAAFLECSANPVQLLKGGLGTGIYYLELSAGEMNADTVAILITTTSVNAKTTPIILYPWESGDIKVQLEGITHTSAVVPTVNAIATGGIVAASLAADAITASKIAADAITEIQSGLSTLTLTQLRTALGTTAGDVLAELTNAIPAATPSLGAAIMLMYMALRNLHTSTATLEVITNDAGAGICQATLADDATTFSKAEFIAVP